MENSLVGSFKIIGILIIPVNIKIPVSLCAELADSKTTFQEFAAEDSLIACSSDKKKHGLLIRKEGLEIEKITQENFWEYLNGSVDGVIFNGRWDGKRVCFRKGDIEYQTDLVLPYTLNDLHKVEVENYSPFQVGQMDYRKFSRNKKLGGTNTVKFFILEHCPHQQFYRIVE